MLITAKIVSPLATARSGLGYNSCVGMKLPVAEGKAGKAVQLFVHFLSISQ
jgi:hypothetical protein